MARRGGGDRPRLDGGGGLPGPDAAAAAGAGAEGGRGRQAEGQPLRAERRRRQHARCSSPPTASRVVDTKLPGWGQPLLDKIKTVTDKPVTTDHQHAHPLRSRQRQRGVSRPRSRWSPTRTPRPTWSRPTRCTACRPARRPNIFKENGGKGMPKRTFKDKMTLGSGADQIDLYHFGRAHTGGDAFVVFPALRRDARRRHVPEPRPADHGQEQRRQRRRVLRHAGQGRGGQRRDTIINGHNADDDDARRREDSTRSSSPTS